MNIFDNLIKNTNKNLILFKIEKNTVYCIGITIHYKYWNWKLKEYSDNKRNNLLSKWVVNIIIFVTCKQKLFGDECHTIFNSRINILYERVWTLEIFVFTFKYKYQNHFKISKRVIF